MSALLMGLPFPCVNISSVKKRKKSGLCDLMLHSGRIRSGANKALRFEQTIAQNIRDHIELTLKPPKSRQLPTKTQSNLSWCARQATQLLSKRFFSCTPLSLSLSCCLKTGCKRNQLKNKRRNKMTSAKEQRLNNQWDHSSEGAGVWLGFCAEHSWCCPVILQPSLLLLDIRETAPFFPKPTNLPAVLP